MSEYRSHLWRILCLLTLATAVQAWMVARNEVPAQDAVNFLRFARQFEHQPISAALRGNNQHPLYPVLVWIAHAALEPWLGSDSLAWVRAAQCVAAAAAVWLVVPMYLAGLRLAGTHIASGAAALFCVLPFAARMGADALSDSTYLLGTMTGFWCAIEFLTSGRCRWLALAGAATGIGYLTRPEAMLAPAALAVTLALMQRRPAWRLPARTVAAAACCGTAGLIAVIAPYAISVQKLTPKGSFNLIPGGQRIFAKFDQSGGRPPVRTLSDGQTIAITPNPMPLPPPEHGSLDFALRRRPDHERFAGYAAATYELMRELVEGLHYLFGLLVLVGLLVADRKPANLFCALLAVLFLALLVQFASRSGYIASRHVLTIVCLACFVAARGGWTVAGWISRMAERGWTAVSGAGFERRQVHAACVLLVAACLFCMPRNAGPLHATRLGHAAAGRWLASFASSDAVVLDSRGWASLYSGLPAYDYHGARLAFEDPRLAYVVVESGELADARPRGETLRHLLAAAGEKVVEFAAPNRGETVAIYSWHADRLIVNRATSLRAN